MGKTHWVTCIECGKRFDASKGGYYYKDSRRYMCKPCHRRLNGNRSVSQKNSAKGSWFSKYWKIIIGLFALIGGTGNFGTDNVAAIWGVIIGLGLLAWYIAPKIIALKKERDEALAEKLELAERTRLCSHCGAQTKGNICEYCGSSLVD